MVTSNKTNSVLLAKDSLDWANQLRDEQETPGKKEQVYHNTLAICAIRQLCNQLGIHTNWNQSASWNFIFREIKDIADLYIDGVGRVECRPLLPNQKTCFLPPEVRQDRIGYFLIELNQDSREAKILGFAPQNYTEYLEIDNLYSFDYFIDLVFNQNLINLRKWLEGDRQAAEMGWGTRLEIRERLEKLYRKQDFPDSRISLNVNRYALLGDDDEELELEQDNQSKEFKLITLKDITVVLRLNKIYQEEEDKIRVLVELYPTLDECLPPNIKLTMLSKSNKVLQEVPSREADNLIRLKRFKGKPGQIFKIKISLGNANLTEQFQC